MYLNTTLIEVRDGSIVCSGNNGDDIVIDCDLVVSAAGYISAPVTNENDRTSNMDYIGDCWKIGNLRTVIWRAYEVAMRM